MENKADFLKTKTVCSQPKKYLYVQRELQAEIRFGSVYGLKLDFSTSDIIDVKGMECI